MIKEELHQVLSFFNYVHVTTISLVSNNKAVFKVEKIDGKKLQNLFFEFYYNNSVTSHDADKVIFNFSYHMFSGNKNSLLSKGFNLAAPPKNID